jgi:hypothetical protein
VDRASEALEVVHVWSANITGAARLRFAPASAQARR